MSLALDLQLFSTEKKEPATPRRRQMAREKGQVPISQDLAAAAGFFGAVVVLRLASPYIVKFTVVRAEAIWQASPPQEVTVGWAMALIKAVFLYAGLASAPVVGAALMLGTLASVAQTGLNMRLNLIAPNFSRVNPISGLTRLFSRRALADCLRSLLKVVLVGLLTYAAIKGAFPEMSALLVREMPSSIALVSDTLEKLLLNCSIFLILAGVLDYLYQWWENEKSLMMTTKEVRDELRESEVKPEVRSAIRARQRQIARRRMMQEVPKAQVVIVNPTHYAVALKYDAGEDAAPVVVAKGLDDLALRIKKIALESHVRVVEDPPLAQALYKAVDIGEMIPPELYKSVAEVLAYVYRVSGKVPGEVRLP